MIKFHDYGLYSIFEDDGKFDISWIRGKEHLSFPITEDLIKKAQLSDTDALEVMFYLEKGHWPKNDEMKHYNETNIITHKGNGFIIYEENGTYEMCWQSGDLTNREVSYPVTKELMEKALKSDQDAEEVMRYLATGLWITPQQSKSDRDFLRKYPELVLKNLSENSKLFSKKEFTQLVEKAIENELRTQNIDSIGIVDKHLELLLVDSIRWQAETENLHLLKLQEKINNYIHYLESKQYVEKYGDNFKEKVIHVTFQYAPSDNGLAFLVQVQKVLQSTDMSLKVTLPD